MVPPELPLVPALSVVESVLEEVEGSVGPVESVVEPVDEPVEPVDEPVVDGVSVDVVGEAVVPEQSEPLAAWENVNQVSTKDLCPWGNAAANAISWGIQLKNSYFQYARCGMGKREREDKWSPACR